MLGLEKINFDSIKNAFTKLGDRKKDRHEKTQPQGWRGPFAETTLENLYLSGRVNRRIVDRPPMDATRRGWEVKAGEHTDEVSEALEDISLEEKCRSAHKKARSSGGALMVFICDDNNKLSEPVDKTSLREVECIHILDRWEVEPANLYQSIHGEEFREPEQWEVDRVSYEDGHELKRDQKIHASRVVKWTALDVPADRVDDYDGFGQPVLEASWEAIRDLDTVTQAMATASHQFQFQILKLNDLNELLRGPDGEANADKLDMRLDMISEGLSFLRMIVLDKEEELETRNVDFDGLLDVYAVCQQNLSASCNIPITLLFGQQTRGFESKDETAIQSYYDYVKADQKEKYKPSIRKAVELVTAAHKGPTDGDEITDFSVDFESLEEPNDTERAETQATVAKADQLYKRMGVLDTDDIKKRFSGDGFQIEIPGVDESVDEINEKTQRQPTEPAMTGVHSTETQHPAARGRGSEQSESSQASNDTPRQPRDTADDADSPFRNDRIRRFHSPDDASLPKYVKSLEWEDRQAFVQAWNATVEQMSDAPPQTLEFLARRNAKQAAGIDLDDADESMSDDNEDARFDQSGKVTGTTISPFIEPPDRVQSLAPDIQQMWVDEFNDFLKNNATEYDSDDALEEAALRDAWNKVFSEMNEG